MKTVVKLIIKDIIRFLNDKPSLLLTFIVPIILIVIFGGSGSPRGKSEVILVNKSNSIVARLIESKLDSSKAIKVVKTYLSEQEGQLIKFNETSARKWITTGKVSAAIIMDMDFFTDTSSSIKFKFLYDPKNQIESSIIQGNIQQIIYSEIPRLMPLLSQRKIIKKLGNTKATEFAHLVGSVAEKYFDIKADSVYKAITSVDSAQLYNSSSNASLERNMMNNLIKFESEQLVGKDIVNPGLTRSVGGWAIMFLLFTLTGAATSMFEEKQEGTLKRLLCMPVTRTQILISKYLYSMILGLIQLFVLFTFSWIIFGVQIFSNFGNLLIVMIASVAAAVSFGMLITSVAKTLQQASGYSTLFILVMSALGGSWFPVSLLPEWMRYASKATLTYWSVEAFLQVLWRQSNFSGVVYHILILISIALLVNLYALIRFRRGWM